MVPASQFAARALLALALILPGTVAAQNMLQRDTTDVRGLPLVELRGRVGANSVPSATGAVEPPGTLAVVLSGDGGWADIDKQIGKTLAERGVDVVGFDDRAYLRGDPRDANSTARDVTRVAEHYLWLWGDRRLVLIGYSRGAAFAPFVVTRMPDELRRRLALVAMLGLPEHASFKYRFSDLWATRTRAQDTPILPEIQRLRGANMMCVYGREEDESLCRSIDSTLVRPFAREGKHHFDGNYRAITDIILNRLDATGP